MNSNVGIVGPSSMKSGNVVIGNSYFFVNDVEPKSQVIANEPLVVGWNYPRTEKCKKCNNDDANKFLIIGSKGRVCLSCLCDKINEPDPRSHPIGQCMICVEDNKELMEWRREGNKMKMCFDCLFDAALFNKASNDFEQHKKL